MKKHILRYIPIIAVVIAVWPAVSAGEEGPANSQWKALGSQGEYIKSQSEKNPELQKEIGEILKARPEFAEGLVDNQDCAKWVLENTGEYPFLSLAVFKWFDKNSSAPDSAWMNDYAAKRLEILSTVDEKLSEEIKELRKEAPDAEKELLGQQSVLELMQNADKFPLMANFIINYAKNHPDAAFVAPVFTIVKVKIIEQTRDLMADKRDEFKQCGSQEEFNEALADASAQARKNFKAADSVEEDIDKEIKAFEAKAKKEFKEYFDKMKVVIARIKKDGEKLEDEFLAQMKKDREEFRKGIVRNFEDEEEIGLALEEYDAIIMTRFVDFCQDIKTKQQDTDEWQKGNKPKADGKLTKNEKDDIVNKLTPPDPNKKKAIAAVDEPEPPVAVVPNAKPDPRGNAGPNSPPPAIAPIAGAPGRGPGDPGAKPQPQPGGGAVVGNLVVTAKVPESQPPAEQAQGEAPKSGKLTTAEKEKLYNEAIGDLAEKTKGGLTDKEKAEIQEKVNKAKGIPDKKGKK